jgi:hypothetical protein
VEGQRQQCNSEDRLDIMTKEQSIYTQVFSQPKPTKRVKVKGKSKIALYIEVHERDGGKCLLSGEDVPFGTIPHHIDYKSSGGSDVIENLATLGTPHYDIHHGDMHDAIQKAIDYHGSKQVVQFILLGILARKK